MWTFLLLFVSSVSAAFLTSPTFLENSEEPKCLSRFDYDYKLLHMLVQLEDAQKKSWNVIEELQGEVNILQERSRMEEKENQDLKSRLHEVSTRFQAFSGKLTQTPLWGSWASWGQCFSNCSGDNSGRVQTRIRVSKPWGDGDTEAEDHEETESRPCNAVQFADCVKQSAGVPDNFAVAYDFADQIAQASCTAMLEAGGYSRAVRRSCSGKNSCDQVCQNNEGTCFNALHVYNGQPALKRGETETIGLTVYRYNHCGKAHCGPNFCCCKMRKF